jgi:hypothetical protein
MISSVCVFRHRFQFKLDCFVAVFPDDCRAELDAMLFCQSSDYTT